MNSFRKADYQLSIINVSDNNQGGTGCLPFQMKRNYLLLWENRSAFQSLAYLIANLACQVQNIDLSEIALKLICS